LTSGMGNANATPSVLKYLWTPSELALGKREKEKRGGLYTRAKNKGNREIH